MSEFAAPICQHNEFGIRIARVIDDVSVACGMFL
jgi:hypothetical protein